MILLYLVNQKEDFYKTVALFCINMYTFISCYVLFYEIRGKHFDNWRKNDRLKRIRAITQKETS